MQVNVFVTRIENEPQTELLVLPNSPEAVIPQQYQSGWKYYATVDTRDQMFGGVDFRSLELELTFAGYAVVKPTAPDRRRVTATPS